MGELNLLLHHHTDQSTIRKWSCKVALYLKTDQNKAIILIYSKKIQ
jgi:hypothetical protein